MKANQTTESSPSITIPYRFDPRYYQLPLFEAMDSGIKRALLRWCRRAGKDKTCFNYMIKAAFERVGSYYYFFPSYAQGRKALWENSDKDSLAIIDHIPEGIREINNNEMKIKIHVPNKGTSIIRVIGTEKIDAVVGSNPVGCVFSEWALQQQEAWDYIRPILAQNDGWAIFNSTPRGKNHMYTMEANIRGNKKWFFSEIQTLWPDLPNYYPVLSQDQILEERKSGMTEELIEQEYGVSYTAGVQGAYFADCVNRAREDGRIGKFPHSDHLWVDTFWDLGYRDDNPIWFRQQDGRAKVWIDYYEDSGKDIGYYVQILKAKGYNYRTHYVPHDAEQGKYANGMSHKQLLVAALRSAGLSDDVVVVPRPSSKQIAIDSCRSQFSYYYFNEATTSDGLIKLSLYHRKYDKNRQVFLEMPVHDFTSHAADAIMNDGLSVHLQEDLMNPAITKIITKFDPFDC